MPIKESEFLKYGTRFGALPGFIFSNPIFTGFFALVVSPLFGAVFVLFQVAGHGEVNAYVLFEASRVGAMFSTGWVAIVFIGVAISAFRHPDEKRYRLLFVLGGALGLLFLIVVDHFTLEYLRAWFAQAGPLV